MSRALVMALPFALMAAFGSAPALALGPSVLVMPFESKGRPLGDAGYLFQLRAVGTIRAVGELGEIHPKMQNRVVQQAEAKLADQMPDERLRTIARALGARFVVTGVLDEQAAISVLTLDVASTSGTKDAPRAQKRIEGKDTITVLDVLPLALFDVLTSVGALGKGHALSDPANVFPMSKHRGALFEFARCSQTLLEQPIGLLNPVVLDQRTLDEAAQHCSTALALDKGFIDAEAALALIDALSGRTKRAEQRIAKLGPSKIFLPEVEVAKFWVLAHAYGTEEALRSLSAAVDAHPSFLLGRGYLGDAYSAIKDYDAAIAVFKAYLEAVPDQPWVMSRIGYNLAKKGDVEGAIDWTQRALKVAPSEAETLLELGSRFIDAKRTKDAITIFRRVIADGGARGEVHLRLGFTYFLDGEYGLAERSFHDAIRLAAAPSEWRTRGRARYDLAKLWMRFDAPENALRHLRAALDEGFRDPAVFVSDPDLQKLSTNAEFKKLMKLAAKPPRRPDQLSPFEVDASTGEQKAEKTHAKKKVPF
ncbi:MAG: tetratricopeptide repeat protein [Deltaproteobacteria bacterium]|nr:tetratricopeptide repeat protein [Deltaproteobacteria bacterium]